MVLSIMRRHAKSWLIKFLIGIIAVVFVFYFGYSFTSDQALKIAYVNGEVISGPEYEKTYRDMVSAYQARYKDMWNENLIKALDLRTRALKTLIDQRLMTQAAKRLGIEVTESECQNAILNYPAFQINGRFDMGRYQALLGQNHMTPEDFEASITQDLLERKLQQFLFAFLGVTEQEILEHYTFVNEKIKIEFVAFNAEDFRKSVTFDEAALKAFFERQKERYRIPKHIQVSYIEIDPDDFKEDVRITEREIQSFYEYNHEAYRRAKQVKARHILFELGEEAQKEIEEKVRETAEAVLAKARKGEDFAELAAAYSSGPSKSKGGDLGYFEKGQMTPAFEEVAFNLKKGEISDLVRTPFGYHIIQVEDIKEARTQPLEEVRDQIVDALTMNIAAERAHEKGLSLVDQMPYDIELSVYAKQHGLEAKKSAFFSNSDPVPGVDGSEKMAETLLALGKHETTELVELEGKFYIFQVAEARESYLPELKEVAERVEEDYRDLMATQNANAAATSYLKALKDGKSWEQLAKEHGLTPKETDFFTRRGPVPDIGQAPELIETAFRLNAQERFADKPFVNENGAFVIRWLEKEGIDETAFAKAKKEYGDALVQAKHQRIFQNWLENLQENADIEIITPVKGES
jgi:peptidyl-prolyl cis-trans isomerase D